jgi:hypothetical protein
MYNLTRLEVEHVLAVLKELRAEDSDMFEEEYDQAIEIMSSLLKECYE